jgi:hypothetical protein
MMKALRPGDLKYKEQHRTNKQGPVQIVYEMAGPAPTVAMPHTSNCSVLVI